MCCLLHSLGQCLLVKHADFPCKGICLIWLTFKGRYSIWQKLYCGHSLKNAGATKVSLWPTQCARKHSHPITGNSHNTLSCKKKLETKTGEIAFSEQLRRLFWRLKIILFIQRNICLKYAEALEKLKHSCETNLINGESISKIKLLPSAKEKGFHLFV